VKKTKYLTELERRKEELEQSIQKEKNIKIKTEGKLSFYEFNQNNSGGSFTVNDKVCHRVIIQAHSPSEARQKALDIGIYFDGCALGLDCSCCGDRWSDFMIEPINLKKNNLHTVSIYHSNDYDAEKRWKEMYGNYKITKKPKWVTKTFKCFEGTIETKNFIEYCQFLANECGWTEPDIRIYYYNGKTKEIFQKKKKYR